MKNPSTKVKQAVYIQMWNSEKAGLDDIWKFGNNKPINESKAIAMVGSPGRQWKRK